VLNLGGAAFQGRQAAGLMFPVPGCLHAASMAGSTLAIANNYLSFRRFRVMLCAAVIS
jgi:hypothetical protein